MHAPSDTQTHHDQHGRYSEAVTAADFRRNLSAVQARFASEFQALDSLCVAEILDRRLQVERRSRGDGQGEQTPTRNRR